MVVQTAKHACNDTWGQNYAWVYATIFRCDFKHQTMTRTERIKDRPPKHKSARRAYVDSLAARGMVSHEGLGMINWQLPGSMEVQLTMRHGAIA